MSRWKVSLNIFGKLFSDDIGQEPGSSLAQFISFSVKAARFRKEMEKIRNSQGKDIVLEVRAS